MASINTEIVIVGSGAGGATVAKELSKTGRKVLIVEKGPLIKQAGIAKRMDCFYGRSDLQVKSREGIAIFRAIAVGGTTVVSCGNGPRALENELHLLGIDLYKEFEETEEELGVKPINNGLIGEGTRRIMKAAAESGFEMEPMPKFIDQEKCISCVNCICGCQRGAIWTALEYLTQAEHNSARLLTNVTITKILISRKKAIGVKGVGPNGEVEIFADAIVLAAGGIGTPIILKKSGVTNAGKRLFVDLQHVTYGITEETSSRKELYMAAINRSLLNKYGFILSTFADNTSTFFVPTLPIHHIPKILHRRRILGIISKIKDEHVGKVDKDGHIEKTVTAIDSAKLDKAASIAKEILIKAGVIPESIITTKPQGAHPGGTAAIGEVVDINQETEIKGLFVSDASILPASPGLPPILTIVALSKRFAKRLAHLL